MHLASRLKLGAASLFGFSPNDVYILKSITHRGWIVRAFRPGASSIPVAPYVYAPICPVEEADIILSERLMAAYRHATTVPHAQTQLSPLWQDNLSHKQSILRNKLVGGDPRDVAEFLATVFRSSAMYGIDSGDLYTGRNWRVHSLKLLDDLVSLAEQLDVTRTESGQATIGHAFQRDLVSLVGAIEEALGASIAFPEVGGPYGLRVGNALLTSTTPEYVYVAWKIKQALLSSPQRSNAADFLEIGAGFGGTALFLFRLLEDQIRQYTIIDLPEMNCLQGYFLAQALGHDRIALCHEPVSRHTNHTGATYGCVGTATPTSMSSSMKIAFRKFRRMSRWATSGGSPVTCADSSTATITNRSCREASSQCARFPTSSDPSVA